MRLVVVVSLLLAVPALAQQPVVPAVVTDPAPDAAHPPRSRQVLIPTPNPAGPEAMNALWYLAAGAGTHPTVVLFHGLPGNEQNLDLAQAMRRAGWNVLTLHYRGSWGSPGVFSIKNVLADADAAWAYVNDPQVAERFAIDRARIVLAGHSMGGFASAWVARHQPRMAGLVLIDAWDVGATGKDFGLLLPEARHKAVMEAFDDFGHSLAGTSETTIADEIADKAAAWSLVAWAPELDHVPMLVIGASQALGPSNHALGAAVAREGGTVTNLTMDTDHSFSDRRIALASAVVGWLQALQPPGK